MRYRRAPISMHVCNRLFLSTTLPPLIAGEKHTAESLPVDAGLSARKVWYHTMKATHPIRRQVLCAMSAVALSAIMLTSVSCTRNAMNDDVSDTTAGTATDTTATTQPDSGNSDTTKPLDPEAGTVNPDSDPANPPAGSSEGTDTGARSRFMPGMNGRR